MIFGTGAALLDTIVLAIISNYGETGSYGYQITQDTLKLFDISESTLYPVLRRLQRDGCLEVYDREFGGRNRRYYKITDTGLAQLNLYRTEWERYSNRITKIFMGRHVE